MARIGVAVLQSAMNGVGGVPAPHCNPLVKEKRLGLGLHAVSNHREQVAPNTDGRTDDGEKIEHFD